MQVPWSFVASVGVAVLASVCPVVSAFEVTVKNDAATDGSQAQECMCFLSDDEAAAWLTTPCTGDIVAVQIFWKSPLGGQPAITEHSITLYAPGSFPNPGSIRQNAGAVPAVIEQPTFTDGAFNEFRFLDAFQPSPQTPLSVPIQRNQTFVVSLRYFNDSTGGVGATTAWDHNGCQGNRNTVQTGGAWLEACAQGVQGDWIIRAVVDCFGDGIPATSEWGLLVLVLLIATAGTIVIHKTA